jgi:uncharacterized membrane protein (DUF106 family)
MTMESGGGAEFWKVFYIQLYLWILHWYILCSGVVLGLWKL